MWHGLTLTLVDALVHAHSPSTLSTRNPTAVKENASSETRNGHTFTGTATPSTHVTHKARTTHKRLCCVLCAGSSDQAHILPYEIGGLRTLRPFKPYNYDPEL